MRCLTKNLHLLNDLLDTLSKSIDIIAVTETRLNSSSLDNIDLEKYNFFNDNSSTNAGGVGIYINKSIKATQELKFDMSAVESCWVELDTGPSKQNVLIGCGCIYKNPSAIVTDFTNELRTEHNDWTKCI